MLNSMKLRKNTIANLVVVAALGLSLTACQDTKARQENEQLKAQVAGLVKESADLGNRVDELTKENAALKQEQTESQNKEDQETKHHRSTSSGQ